jgi:hypothetical protein
MTMMDKSSRARRAKKAVVRVARLAMAGTMLTCAINAYAVDAPTSRTLDDFSQPNLWKASGTDDISASLRPVDGKDAHDKNGRALCLDFDFHGVSGGVTLHRALPINFPANYALSFDVRGAMPANDLQLRLIDASGDNVWWYRHEAFQPNRPWQTIDVGKRDIDFAWGTSKDKTLRQSSALEFTVYAGHGGKGELCFSHLRLTPLAPTAASAQTTPTDDPNKTPLMQQARRAARGMYPRGLSGEQSYWILVGVDGGAAHSALMSEDGAVEVGKGGWSIEPMLFDGQAVIDWANVKTDQRLLDGYLPIPTVRWQAQGLRLETTTFASGTPKASNLLMQYRLHNDTDSPRTLTLALLVRPFQVNPPTQFLNMKAGISPIHDLDWSGRALQVNHALQVVPLQTPTAFVASPHAAVTLPEQLASGASTTVRTDAGSASLHDDSGFAQGALLYRLTVPAHGEVMLGLVVPNGSAADVPPSFASPRDAARWLGQQQDQTAAAWREKLNRVTLQLPPAQQAIADTARSTLAQILMSRNGDALQPGTRSYARSWIRDGAMMSEALLRSGHADAAGEFVNWYAPQQFHTGKVPCCIDQRGADPVPENDSQGELIFAIAQWWRYTHDRAGLEKLWPHVVQTVTYMDTLRASERTAANQTDARRSMYGLMPASISHEGYWAKPMHSYWDDFWSLIGYQDAVELATALDKTDEAARFAASRDQFQGDFKASIALAMQQHHIDYLPGSAELGDFDATSTTIALSPGDAIDWLPPSLLPQTFEKYWQAFIARRDGMQAWTDYTPYEIRTIASFVRLGWRDRLQQLFAFFFDGRRPAAWNQWAEVVGHDPRQPRFVGDMPHAWIASDFMRSAYDMFAYQRSGDHALVLAAGMAPAWLAGKGVGIEHLRTPYGELSYTLRERGTRLQLNVAGGLTVPAGGLVLPWPYPGKPPAAATLDGKPATWRGDEIVIRSLPAVLSIEKPR